MMMVPQHIENMQVLLWTEIGPHRQKLSKYLRPLPERWVVVQEEGETDICIIGTDTDFTHWERYPNYVFKDLEEALEAPYAVFGLDPIIWKKTDGTVL